MIKIRKSTRENQYAVREEEVRDQREKKKKRKKVLERYEFRTQLVPLEIPEVQAMTTTDLRRFLLLEILTPDLAYKGVFWVRGSRWEGGKARL
jgi:hypothetical protein